VVWKARGPKDQVKAGGRKEAVVGSNKAGKVEKGKETERWEK
jgi:hypothetical protein